jgi:hypothetical protein
VWLLGSSRRFGDDDGGWSDGGGCWSLSLMHIDVDATLMGGGSCDGVVVVVVEWLLVMVM